MDLQLSGTKALVTGATQGIGSAITGGLVDAGAYVVGCGLGTDSRAQTCVTVDLCEPGAAQALVSAAETAMGGLDVIVAAAGGSVGGTVGQCSDQDWDKGIMLNLLSVVQLCRLALPLLCKSEAARILLFGAVSGFEPKSGNAIANVAKAGVHALTKTMSLELARFDILVNCIAPGRIRSEQLDRIFPDEEVRRTYAQKNIPLGRFGQPSEIVPLALLLMSRVNTYITGQVICVDGGMVSGI